MGMDQYLLIPFLVGWTSIYQLFWCSPGVQGFDTLPYEYTYIYIYTCIWIVCWAAQLWFQSWFLFRFFNQQVDAAYIGLLQIYLCLGQEDLLVRLHIASLPKIFSCSVIGQPEDCRLRPGHDLQVINCWRRPRPTGAYSICTFVVWFCMILLLG